MKRLDSVTANALAAGEVIAGPSSVVKELVENSLDAEATRIRISLNDCEMIEVIDNGIGLTRQALEQLGPRFTTSKWSIADKEEMTVDAFLSQLTSFGFRGEALASLTLASRAVVIESCKADATVGYSVTLTRESTVPNTVIPCAMSQQGTRVRVLHLFADAAPIRRTAFSSGKFKKELSRIQSNLFTLALARPGVLLTLRRAGAGSTLDARFGGTEDIQRIVRQRFGNLTADSLQPFERILSSSSSSSSSSGISLNGWASGPDCTSRRGEIVILINGRPVEGGSGALLRKTVQAAYSSTPTLPAHTQPFVLVQIKTNSLVDVNVDAAKTTVGLVRDEQLISSVLFDCIRSLLRSGHRSSLVQHPLSALRSSSQGFPMTSDSSRVGRVRVMAERDSLDGGIDVRSARGGLLLVGRVNSSTCAAQAEQALVLVHLPSLAALISATRCEAQWGMLRQYRFDENKQSIKTLLLENVCTSERERQITQEILCSSTHSDILVDGLGLDCTGGLLRALPALLGPSWPLPIACIPALLQRLGSVLLTEESPQNSLIREAALFTSAGSSSANDAALRSLLMAPERPSISFLVSRHIVQPLVSVDSLYRVFERC